MGDCSEIAGVIWHSSGSGLRKRISRPSCPSVTNTFSKPQKHCVYKMSMVIRKDRRRGASSSVDMWSKGCGAYILHSPIRVQKLAFSGVTWHTDSQEHSNKNMIPLPRSITPGTFPQL